MDVLGLGFDGVKNYRAQNTQVDNRGEIAWQLLDLEETSRRKRDTRSLSTAHPSLSSPAPNVSDKSPSALAARAASEAPP